jgi:ribosomal protein S18 acetylase RimI-like enzyme
MTTVTRAELHDLPEILQLQYLAYQSEAALFGSRDIPPLKQTLGELTEEYRRGVILKMTDDAGTVIGSVRAREADGTVYIGKLMVHPAHQHRGYGTQLLHAIEDCFPDKRYELFTSTRSAANIRLYQRLGYRIFRTQAVNDELEFVYLEKP